MGRVKMFTTGGCKHCGIVQQILEENGVGNRLVTVSVDEDAVAMKELRELLAARQGAPPKDGKKKNKKKLDVVIQVPVVLFNDRFIGGREEIERMQTSNVLAAEIASCLLEPSAKFDTEVELYQRSLKGLLDVPPDIQGIESYSKLRELPEDSAHPLGKTYRKVGFLGGLLAEYLNKLGVQADGICSAWLESGRLREFTDSALVFPGLALGVHFTRTAKYRFAEDLSPDVLNMEQGATRRGRSAGDIAYDVQRRVRRLQDKFISADGRGVNYEKMAASPLYLAYREATWELTAVDLKALVTLGASTCKAFWINLYNALMIHASIVRGQPKSAFARMRFFNHVAYVVGGSVFSLNDIEHGVLRGNVKAPLGRGRRLKSDDPRVNCVLPLDPRIHFALVCGAKSCPPIQVYNLENVEEALDLAAASFINQEVQFEPDGSLVHLSKLFKWYGKDFGAKPRDVLRWCSEYFNEENRARFERAMALKKVTIKFLPYSWDSNGRDYEEDRESESPRMPSGSTGTKYSKSMMVCDEFSCKLVTDSVADSGQSDSSDFSSLSEN